MNKLKVFNYKNNEVRTIQKDGEPWFVLKDVAAILAIDNHKDLPKRLEADEVGRFDFPHPQSAGKTLEMTCINESGLYNVILRSDKPEAKPFRKWVTSEVLPSIRKTGAYMTPETIEKVLLNPDTIISLATQLKELQAKIEQDKPKVLFAGAVEASGDSILVGNLAKILRQNGVEIGQNRLFQWLRDNNYLCAKGERYNMPTQRAMELELFEVKESAIANPDGSVRVTRTTKVTGKGQTYFVNKFLGEAS